MEAEANNGAPARPASEPCKEYSERVYLLGADELERDDEITVKAHTKLCVRCAAYLADVERLNAMFESAPRQEPSANLLAECRSNLTEVLDDADDASRRGVFGQWLDAIAPARWLTMHPAAAAVLLLLIGFSAGTYSPLWVSHFSHNATPVSPGAAGSGDRTPQPLNEASIIPFSDQDLRTADVTGINLVSDTGDAPPQIEVQLNAQRPMLVHGSVSDDRVKQLLLYVVRNNQRFDPDVRIESVDLLKPRTHDEDVCQALCVMVHTDRNPAVRLKALEALSAEASQESVRNAMLGALVDDVNPGVRIEAINSLRELADKGQVPADAHLLAVLRERAQKDSSTYIRLQSAATLQALNPAEKF
ncbi:MAG TPA: HEAT repeat domain-containing protein [Candidatus Acidoferrales bacterium]